MRKFKEWKMSPITKGGWMNLCIISLVAGLFELCIIYGVFKKVWGTFTNFIKKHFKKSKENETVE